VNGVTRLYYGAYEHPITPVVVMTEDRVGQTGGAGQAWLRTWDIRGDLFASGPAALQTLADALVTAYAADGSDLQLRADNGVDVLEELDHSDSLRGVKVIKRPEFPEGGGVELATRRSYHIVVQAEYTTPAAYSSTAYGWYTTSESLDAQGQYLITRTGRYTGPGREAAADAAKLTSGYLTLSEEQTDDQDRQEITFTYQYKDTGSSRDTISFVESVELDAAVSDFVLRTVLDGGTPIKQSTVLRPARVQQTGEAVGLDDYPSFPAYLFAAASLKGDRRQKRSPKRAGDGTLTEYGIAWQYTFEFATDPAFASPGTPPND
jgi:hypothetical protein